MILEVNWEMNNKIKVAFLDRDGTIVKEYDDEGWINRTEPEILNGSVEALRQMNDLGYQIIIITNQGLINQGLIKLEEYNKFNDNLLKVLKKNQIEILDIFCCPHTKDENCECKKPKPGMILKACEKYNIDMDKSFVCGDTCNDEGIAEYFGLKFFGVNYTSKNKKNIKINNLLDIIPHIKELDSLLQMKNMINYRWDRHGRDI